jgi:hypothetical protein
MLEIGPLVGLIQIPGIKFGAKDVVTLATLNSAIADSLDTLHTIGIVSLESQSSFIAMCLEAWLEASGRLEPAYMVKKRGLDSSNVAYQGRVLVSILTLLPAMILELKKRKIPFNSEKAKAHLQVWLRSLAQRAGLLKDGVFLDKAEFKERRYLGAGGIGLFRSVLWAAAGSSATIKGMEEKKIGSVEFRMGNWRILRSEAL